MDTTAIGIAAGLLITVAYTLIRVLRQKSFDIGTTMLVFLGGFAIPGGTHLIRAALSGNPNTLPTAWREYVAVAGIAAIGLSANFIFKEFRNAWPKQETATPTSEHQGEAAPTDDLDS